eukprot:1820683-Rhodomonas_salina.3
MEYSLRRSIGTIVPTLLCTPYKMPRTDRDNGTSKTAVVPRSPSTDREYACTRYEVAAEARGPRFRCICPSLAEVFPGTALAGLRYANYTIQVSQTSKSKTRITVLAQIALKGRLLVLDFGGVWLYIRLLRAVRDWSSGRSRLRLLQS